MLTWIKHVAGLPPALRRKVLWSTGLLLLALAIVFAYSFWRDPVSESPIHWTSVQGSISTDPKPWSEDRELVGFSVRYLVPEGVRDRAPAYANQAHFQSVQVKKGSEVVVDIEYINGEVIVQRVRSVEGAVLYDPALREHVRQVENRFVVFICGVFGVFGLSCLTAALVFRLRSRSN